MLRDKLFYYLANYTLQHTFEKEIVKFINSKKRLVIFDVGCYRGVFTKTISNLIVKKKHKFYLFDINKKVKKYIQNLIKLKNFYYNEIALSNKNGQSSYNYNSFFESAGSSLSNIVKDDIRWNFSRRLLLGFFLYKTKNFTKYKVKTMTVDNFVKKKKIHSIDILKIDIEGSEHDLLKGAKNSLKFCKSLIVEVSTKDIYKGGAIWEDVKNFLTESEFGLEITKYLNQIKDSSPSTQNTYQYAKIIYEL